MVPPPANELEVLYALALTGDMRNIRVHADHLTSLGEPYGRFAQRLRELADAYRPRAVLELVNQFRDSGARR
jgi:hypothetical protein